MPEPIVRKNDQAPLATIALIALAVMAIYWVSAGGPTGRMIEIDLAEPLAYEFLVDVNDADWPELAQLPDIGEVLARRIVETRVERGPFKSTDDLLEVSGIGRVKLSRIAPHLLPMPDDRAVAAGR
ncbi:MAG: ComEA family DNA-binding protein [Aeoliella sp.]